MNAFFLFLELFLYIFPFYLIWKKGELAIVYLPVLFFSNTLIVQHAVSAMLYYLIITLMLMVVIYRNGNFFKANVFAALLFFYFAVLLGKSDDFVKIRESLFNVGWLLVSIPLITTIYCKYNREAILEELSSAGLLLLVIFIVNVALSTYFHYTGYEMYGITSGILYGNLYATDYNVLSIAIFAVVLHALDRPKVLNLAVVGVSLLFIALSMRRSVMAVSGLGVMIAAILYFMKDFKKAILIGVASLLLVGIVLAKTNVTGSFAERYELRNLDERSLDEEKRLFEYELLYRDMFVLNRYSPWFGYGLFDSAGHYGNGKFYDRSLHGDITSIVHSGGVIALLLYMAMMFYSFRGGYTNAASSHDYGILIFWLIAFITFTFTGRYTQVGCMFFLMLIVNIPLTAAYRKPSPSNAFPGHPLDGVALQ